MVGKAFLGAVIQIEQHRLVLSQQMGSFKARLNKEGELDIIYRKGTKAKEESRSRGIEVRGRWMGRKR